jgi:hypothetical protein
MGHGRGRGKTKPISTSRALAPVVLMGARAHATERLAASPRLRGDDIATDRASAPNKPNFGTGDLEDKCRVNKELRPIGCTNGPRKTKPIRPGGRVSGVRVQRPAPGARSPGRLYRKKQEKALRASKSSIRLDFVFAYPPSMNKPWASVPATEARGCSGVR